VTTAASRIHSWQKKFFAQPVIYYTWSVYFAEPTGNFYESKEAAQVEVDYCAKKREKIVIREVNLHNLELSRERWVA
jgi:hypothetical protein